MAPGVMCRLDLPGNPSQPFHYRINLNYARAGAWGDILLLVRRRGARGHTRRAKGAYGVALALAPSSLLRTAALSCRAPATCLCNHDHDKMPAAKACGAR